MNKETSILKLIDQMFSHLESIGEKDQEKFEIARKRYMDYYLLTGGIHPELALHIAMPPTNKPFKTFDFNEGIKFIIPEKYKTLEVKWRKNGNNSPLFRLR